MASNNVNPQWYFGSDSALSQQSRDGLTQMMQYVWSLRNQQANLNQTIQNFNNNVTDKITAVAALVGNISNNTNSSGTPTVIFGSHAQRLTGAYLPSLFPGWFYIETDRSFALYYSNGAQWILIEATGAGSFENRYTGLGAQDIGFGWYETSRNNVTATAPLPYYRWTGASWSFISGAFYRNQNAVATLAGTFASNNSNGGNDTGAIVNVVDFAGQLQWQNNGTWGWGPEDSRMHGMGPIFAEIDPNPTIGWHLYDGSNNVNYLQANGNVGSVNLVALSGANASGNTFLAAANVNSNINAPIAPVFTGNAASGSVSGSFSGSGSGNSGNFTSSNLLVSAGNTTVLTGPNPVSVSVTVSGSISGSLAGNNVTGSVSNNATPQSLNRRAWFRQ